MKTLFYLALLLAGVCAAIDNAPPLETLRGVAPGANLTATTNGQSVTLAVTGVVTQGQYQVQLDRQMFLTNGVKQFNAFVDTAGNATLSADGAVILNAPVTNAYATTFTDDVSLTGAATDFSMAGGNMTVTGAVHTFKAGGAATLVVTNNRVGVGTTAPAYALDVNGDVRGEILRVGYTALQGRLTSGSFTNHSSSFVVTASANNALTLGANARSTDLTIVSSGWVGIGTNIPQSQLHVAGTITSVSNVVQSTLIASNVVLSAVKWVDCASHIYWGTGRGAGSAVTNLVDIIESGDGTLAMAFSQTNGTERLPFVAEVPHTIADTNATITAASLYTEAHIHVRPLTNATTLTNVAFQIVWKGCGDKFGSTNGPAVTNTITFAVGSSNTTQLVEANHMLYTTFHPSVAATFPGTWTRVAASSNNYPGPILIQTPSVHVPVGWPNAIGSNADNAP